jgi:hypothetical protein
MKSYCKRRVADNFPHPHPNIIFARAGWIAMFSYFFKTKAENLRNLPTVQLSSFGGFTVPCVTSDFNLVWSRRIK